MERALEETPPTSGGVQTLDVYSYLDYRTFCRDFYQNQKILDPRFSFRSFARVAQVASSYLKHIIDGTRNLSPEMSHKFAAGMGLDDREADYFETLIRFQHASNLEEKSHFLDRLRRKRARALKPIGMAEAVNLLSHWYVIAIKELVVILNSVEPRKIQSILRKKLSEALIHETIEQLRNMGWLFVDQGVWASRATQIQFPDEVKSFVVSHFHRQMLGIASDALNDELSDREFGAAVFTFPRSKFPELKAKIKDLQMELVSYVQDLNNGAIQEDLSVYHFGLQCFSLQKLPSEKEDSL